LQASQVLYWVYAQIGKKIDNIYILYYYTIVLIFYYAKLSKAGD